MNWSAYESFLVVAAVLVILPGPDFAVVTRNALVGGRRRGWWSAVGVSTSNSVQGIAAAAGLAAVIVRVEPLFQAIRWAGIGYLLWLGVQALRSAVRGTYAAPTDEHQNRAPAFAGWRQGFLSNVTNPKVLVFYLAVLPQFLGRGAGIGPLLLFALSHALLSLLYLVLVVAGMQGVRRWLVRRRVRRAMDALTGVALLGFSARLAAQQS